MITKVERQQIHGQGREAIQNSQIIAHRLANPTANNNKNTKYVLQELKISAIGNRENDDRQLLCEKVEKENTLKQNRKRKAANINT